jgi:hypothetical protein
MALMSLDSCTMVRLAWIALLALVTVAIPVTVMGAIAFLRAPEDKNPAYTFSQLFERAKTLQMMTVIVIVVSASFLALCGIINSNGIVGILSGIAGYVLGGLSRQARGKPGDQKPRSQTNQSEKTTEPHH